MRLVTICSEMLPCAQFLRRWCTQVDVTNRRAFYTNDCPPLASQYADKRKYVLRSQFVISTVIAYVLHTVTLFLELLKCYDPRFCCQRTLCPSIIRLAGVYNDNAMFRMYT